MLLYTLLFTLVGRNPKENKYIDMFFIWLTYVIRNGGLTEKDKVVILIDSPTLDYLNTFSTLSDLIDHSIFEFELHLIQEPHTLLQGISERYNFAAATAEAHHDTNFFLDLDILVMRDINFNLLDNTILVMPEGSLADMNYGGHLLDLKDAPPTPGFSAGWFAFTKGEGVSKFFKHILIDCQNHEDKHFYTVDQPYFNKHVYLNMTESLVNIVIENGLIMPNNIYTIDSSVKFVNYCGEPGDDYFHIQKLLNMLCNQFILTKAKAALIRSY